MNQTKKIKIGITGSIGAGKSSVSKFLTAKGYEVLNADIIAKELLQSDQTVKEKIIKEFGQRSYKNNNVDRKYLAEKAFSSEASVLKINSIVHPALIKKISSLSNEYLKSENLVFTEAALIYEAEMEDVFDYVLLVTSSEGKRLNRKMKSENYSEEEFFRRDRNQIPDEEKKKRADFILENNGSLEDLKKKTEFILTILQGLLSAND